MILSGSAEMYRDSYQKLEYCNRYETKVVMNKFFFTLLLSYFCSLYTTSFLPADSLADTNTACIEYIPTAISPNGDGINDEFQIRFSCKIGDYTLEIFDESDQLIHRSTDHEASWNGLTEKGPAPEGYYSYVIQYRSSRRTLPEREEGEIALVR